MIKAQETGSRNLIPKNWYHFWSLCRANWHQIFLVLVQEMSYFDSRIWNHVIELASFNWSLLLFIFLFIIWMKIVGKHCVVFKLFNYL